MKSFKMLVESKTGTFEELVTAYLNDGWELHGPTFFTDRRFAQAIVKTQRQRKPKSESAEAA